MKTYKIEIFTDRSGGGHRFRLRAPNGRIMLTSGESYSSPGNARRAVKRLPAVIESAEIVRAD